MTKLVPGTDQNAVDVAEHKRGIWGNAFLRIPGHGDKIGCLIMLIVDQSIGMFLASISSVSLYFLRKLIFFSRNRNVFLMI